MSGTLVTFLRQVELARREGRHFSPNVVSVGLAIVGRLRGDMRAVCWPSIKTISEDAAVCERTAGRAIKHLEETKVLLVSRGAGPGGTNLYRLRPLGPVSASVDAQSVAGARQGAFEPELAPQQGELDFGVIVQPGWPASEGTASDTVPPARGAPPPVTDTAPDTPPPAPDTDKLEGMDRRGVGAGAREDFETGFEEETPPGALIERVKAAVLDAGGSLGAFWDGPAARNEIDRWRALGLSPEQIVGQVLAEQRRVGSGEAGGPRAFTRAMLRLAGQLAAPAYQPTPGPSWQPRVVSGGGRRSRHDDEDLNPGTNHLGRWYAGPPC